MLPTPLHNEVSLTAYLIERVEDQHAFDDH
jgi:hypothetical protein